MKRAVAVVSRQFKTHTIQEQLGEEHQLLIDAVKSLKLIYLPPLARADPPDADELEMARNVVLAAGLRVGLIEQFATAFKWPDPDLRTRYCDELRKMMKGLHDLRSVLDRGEWGSVAAIGNSLKEINVQLGTYSWVISKFQPGKRHSSS